jgi:hypothetical protein
MPVKNDGNLHKEAMMKTYREYLAEQDYEKFYNTHYTSDYYSNKGNEQVVVSKWVKMGDKDFHLKNGRFDLVVQQAKDNTGIPSEKVWTLNITLRNGDVPTEFLKEFGYSYKKVDGGYVVAGELEVINSVLTELGVPPISLDE